MTLESSIKQAMKMGANYCIVVADDEGRTNKYQSAQHHLLWARNLLSERVATQD
jgi:hypothetical protein